MKLFKNINYEKLKNGLSKTRDKIFNRISETLSGKAVIDESVLDELEEILISGDIGFDIVNRIIEQTRISLKKEQGRDKESVLQTLKEELTKILLSQKSSSSEFEIFAKFKPTVILIVGINGAGKTTTIGKLAHNYKNAGLNVIIGAADTFRAAANEQLEIWAKRAGVELIQKSSGTDPSSVVYDTLEEALKRKIDVVLIDTAGRLHTKINLMDELKKIKKVASKILDYAPNEVLLVVDGNNGQNAIIQAREFSKYTDLTGLIVTKLDGTAKGGALFQISSELKIPVRYIGVGEGIEDLQTFDPTEYVNALFSN
ncbi:MAG: signal recognition particle-docking protein FtsY [bacterium]